MNPNCSVLCDTTINCGGFSYSAEDDICILMQEVPTELLFTVDNVRCYFKSCKSFDDTIFNTFCQPYERRLIVSFCNFLMVD